MMDAMNNNKFGESLTPSSIVSFSGTTAAFQPPPSISASNVCVDYMHFKKNPEQGMQTQTCLTSWWWECLLKV
jgi:hypothetical protein